MKFLIIFALCLTVIWARPQRFPIQQFPGQGLNGGDNNIFFPFNNNNFNDDDTVATTAAPAGIATTASPQYLTCLQSCPSTMEYNPICGSDMESYHNTGRLSCAQRCGKNVAALRMGTCQPL